MNTVVESSRAAWMALMLAVAALVGSGVASRTYAQQERQNQEVHVLPVQGNVYMLAGAGANVTLQVGADGVLLVDTQFEHSSDKILAEIRRLSDRPIRTIINTHIHSDHTGGNENIAKAGSSRGGTTAAVISHENVLTRMSKTETPLARWPTSTYFGESKELFFNGEAVQVIHTPAAHTDGDSIVFFRRSDVVSTGDIFVTTSYPVIDAQNGGSIQGIIDGLNRILDITVPSHNQEGGTMVIPGHGRLSEEHEVLEYRDMVTIIRDRIQDLVKKGLTLEQVKATKPTLDYDARFGAATGSWTTAMFIEAVYRDVSSPR